MSNDARKPPPWLEQALHDPGSVFATPEEVVDHPDLTLEEKARVLRSWEYDVAEIAVAEEEGMRGPEGEQLQRILLALAKLVAGRSSEFVAPTKQHGLF